MSRVDDVAMQAYGRPDKRGRGAANTRPPAHEEEPLMSSTNGNGRRSHGTGSLYARSDSAGRQSWYGQWRAGGRRHKRCLGPVRSPGARDGLTRTQAEAKLRRLIAETPATRTDEGAPDLGRHRAALPASPRSEGAQALDDRRGHQLPRGLAAARARRPHARRDPGRTRRGPHGPDGGRRPTWAGRGGGRSRAGRRRFATTSAPSARSPLRHTFAAPVGDRQPVRRRRPSRARGLRGHPLPRARRSASARQRSLRWPLSVGRWRVLRHGGDDGPAPRRAHRSPLA